MKLLVLTLLYLLAFGSHSRSQPADRQRKYSVGQLKQEVSLLKKALEEAHPSLYWYTPKKEIDDSFTLVERQIREPLTKREFYRVLAPAITRIRCGHTYLLMAPGEDPSVTYLPFDLWLDQNRLYVVNNNSKDSTIQAGDEITHINGYSIDKIVRKGNSIQSADGYNQTFKQHILNWHLLEDVAWEYFGNDEPFQLTIVSADSKPRLHAVYKKPRSTVVPAPVAKPEKIMSEVEKQTALEHQRVQDLEKTRSYKLLAETPSTALLTVNGFGYDNAEAFHQQVFEQLNEKKIQHLLIDLRQNTGGNVLCATSLMSYLMDAPFKIVGDCWAKLQNPNNPSFNQYFDENTKRLLSENTTYTRREGNRFYFKTAGDDCHEPKKRHVFKGHVYLLTSGFTFSAGSLFAIALQAQRQVTVIGQETGGGQAGCSGSIIQTLTLPTTHLQLKFPLFRVPSVSNALNSGHGLIPDYVIHYRWQDKKMGKDLEIEKALELIRGQVK